MLCKSCPDPPAGMRRRAAENPPLRTPVTASISRCSHLRINERLHAQSAFRTTPLSRRRQPAHGAVGEGLRAGADRAGEGVEVERAVGQQVRDAQHGRDVKRLRDPKAVDQVAELLGCRPSPASLLPRTVQRHHPPEPPPLGRAQPPKGVRIWSASTRSLLSTICAAASAMVSAARNRSRACVSSPRWLARRASASVA
jgi:hypothetical protein